jgi:ethanolamine ammonia-lyase large subunit
LKEEVLKVLASNQDADLVAQVVRVVQKKKCELGITKEMLLQVIPTDLRVNSDAISCAIK